MGGLGTVDVLIILVMTVGVAAGVLALVIWAIRSSR
jgi:hypothetical protein